jgi:hypothetical protein
LCPKVRWAGAEGVCQGNADQSERGTPGR